MKIVQTQQFKILYQQTLPMLVGLFTIMGSQLVDSIFISQLGATPLAVVGFSIPIYQLIVGVQVGLGIAATACISTAIGAKEFRYAKNLSALVLILGVTVISVLCLLLWIYQETIIASLGADKAIFGLSRQYWLPWLISCWLGASLYFGYSICRSHGDNFIPGKVMVITSVLNILLDPLFIFALNMGLQGAAWATCVSFAIGCAIIFKTAFNRRLMSLSLSMRKVKDGLGTLIRFSIPATLSQFIPPLSAMLVTAIVASYGIFAVGAWGVAHRIEYIAIIVILALTMSLPPLIGQLRGKNDTDVIFQLVKVAASTILYVQLAISLVIITLSNPIASLLTTNESISANLQYYLMFVPISYGALGVCMISVSACNAMGMPKPALITSMLRLFGCYLPMIWVGSEFYGLEGVFIGACVGNFLSGIVGWAMFLNQYKKLSETTREIALA